MFLQRRIVRGFGSMRFALIREMSRRGITRLELWGGFMGEPRRFWCGLDVKQTSVKGPGFLSRWRRWL